MEVKHQLDILYGDEVYYIKEKLSNGQTLEFGFNIDHCDCTNRVDFWNVYLTIYSKRKHKGINEDKCLSTGTGNPFEAFAMIKKALPEIENQIIAENNKRDNVFFVHWTDNKRRDVYTRFLTRYGYKLDVLDCQKCLLKRINRVEK